MSVFSFKNIFSTVINFGLGYYSGYSKGGSDARRECEAEINESAKILSHEFNKLKAHIVAMAKENEELKNKIISIMKIPTDLAEKIDQQHNARIAAIIESDPYVDSPNDTLFHLCNDGNESYLKYSHLCSSNNTFYCKLQDKPLVDVSLPNTTSGITPESLEF